MCHWALPGSVLLSEQGSPDELSFLLLFFGSELSRPNPKKKRPSLEPELGEEPLGLSGLELLLEDLPGLDGSSLPLGGVLHDVWGDARLKIDVEGVPRGHQVVVVDELDEGLHLHPLLPGLLRGALGHLPGVLGEPNHEGVSVWPGVGAIVVVSDDDGLLAGVPSGQEDDDLVVLEEPHHCARVSTLVSAASPM